MTDNIELMKCAYECGRNEASWVFPIETPNEVLRAYLAGDELFEPWNLRVVPPHPFSGEWAGESVAERLYGLVPDPSNPTEEELDTYEEYFVKGWEEELHDYAKWELAQDSSNTTNNN